MLEIIKSKYKLYYPSLLCSTSGKPPRNKEKAKKNVQVNPPSARQLLQVWPPGHWDSDCQLEGGIHSTRAVSPSPRSRYGGGSARGDCYGSDHRYTDDQYDRGHYADRECYDSRDDRCGSRDRFANDRHPPGGDRFAGNKYGVSDQYAQNGSGKMRGFDRDVGRGDGGSYQGYSASGDNPSSYDRMDTNRYMQSQNTGGGYPPCGSSGYGTPGYGYGSSNNGMGYGGYGSYGGANPGYGGVNPGYGGPAVAAFGNPNVPATGFGSGPASGPGSSRDSQGPSGYGNMGNGNASWGASSGGPARY